MEKKITPHVVIIGGGFGGLMAARKLAGSPVRITLIDRKNHHTFQPLLYQVATAGLSPGEIAAPIRWILRGRPNIQVLLAEVEDFDLTRRVVKTSDGDISYDNLSVAADVTTAYFRHADRDPLAPGLESRGEA